MSAHPRPVMKRAQWSSLEGVWEFAFGEDGETPQWREGRMPLPRTIEVPFAPQAPASGIGVDPASGVVWYRRVLDATELQHDAGERVLLHFGAVDHEAEVWINGHLVARHRGGQVPFSADITDDLSGHDENVLVVRAADSQLDAEIPRGKQAWAPEPHFIWYDRTIGIWRTPWLEVVPGRRVEDVSWTTDISWGVRGSVEVSGDAIGARLRVEICGPQGILAEIETEILAQRTDVSIPIVALRNAQARGALLWSPDSPTLLDVIVSVSGPDGVVDEIQSYVGIREVAIRQGRFTLNRRPFRTRAVLSQGYWPESHFTAPSTAALEHEARRIKQLGFNAVRVHQKIEDPRFLEIADRIGLLVWAEAPAAYAFSVRAAETFLSEWLDSIRSRRSHPSVVCWVPFNESWGVQDLVADAPQRDFVRALTTLTRAVDPTRPVISNDGWEHVDSDIVGIHDYSDDMALLDRRYGTPDAAVRTALGSGPQGHPIAASAEQRDRISRGEVPLMLSEFGGTSWSDDEHAWGYAAASGAAALEERLEALFGTVHRLAFDGFCYTQLTDTAQEANGLLWSNREPKVDIETIRRLVTGTE